MKTFILSACLAILSACACEPGEHGWSNDVEHIPGTSIVAPEPFATVERIEESIACP